MANQFPYISSVGSIVQAMEQFRKKLPQKVDSDTLKQLEIAPNNESYLISIIKFLGIIDEDGTPDSDISEMFYSDDEGFHKGLAEVLENAYSSLFDLHGETAWNLDKSKLTSFFRQSDKTSEIVGSRQANTFAALASCSSNRTIDEAKAPIPKKTTSAPKKTKTEKKSSQPAATIAKPADQEANSSKNVSLSVRVEVVLPSNSSKETYDHIFKSIRENLIDTAE